MRGVAAQCLVSLAGAVDLENVPVRSGVQAALQRAASRSRYACMLRFSVQRTYGSG